MQSKDLLKVIENDSAKNKMKSEELPAQAENKTLKTTLYKKEHQSQCDGKKFVHVIPADPKASKQWIQMEESYQQQIRTLQGEADSALREKSFLIDDLLKKVKSLEQDLSRNDRELFGLRPPVKNKSNTLPNGNMTLNSANQGNKENEVQHARCATPNGSTKYQPLSEKKNCVAASLQPPNVISLSSVSSSRATALRGAGGRSGLKKKLEKIRGINKTVTFVAGQ